MALHMTAPTVRLTLAVSLSALLAACSIGQRPSAMALDIPNQANQGIENTGTSGYTTVVPRAFIGSEQLEPDAPSSYTVVRGDTLWDISDRFLKKPWMWTEIWNYNPQIYNPHLIFPGDKLALEYVNGEPTLVLTRNGKPVPLTPALGAANPEVLDANGNPIPQQAASGGRTRLSPRIRSESLESAIPTIAHDSIQQFLVHPRVVDLNMVNSAPYVIANMDERLISSVGSRIYARGALDRSETQYGIYRRNKELRDPVNNVLLGYEITHIGDAKLLSTDKVSTLTIISNNMETMNGDILLPASDMATQHSYVPRLPEIRGDGRIVSLVNAISQTGRDQVVVLNIGAESNIQEGDVMAIETRGGYVIDGYGRRGHEYVELPNERTGVVMVFKTFDKVSYALVMESTRPVMINDIVTGI